MENIFVTILIFNLWVVIGVVGFMFLSNMLTKGFFMSYMKVKAGRGKSVLARIHSATDTYYMPAKWSDGFLKVKTRGKVELSLPIASEEFKSFLKRTLGVSEVEISEEGKQIINSDLVPVQFIQFEPARVNSLILAIKNRPREMSQKEKIMIFLGIATLLGILYIGYSQYQMAETIATLQQISGVIQ